MISKEDRLKIKFELADKYIAFCKDYQDMLRAKYPEFDFEVLPQISTEEITNWTLPYASQWDIDDDLMDKIADQWYTDEEDWYQKNNVDEDEIIMAFIRTGREEYLNSDT